MFGFRRKSGPQAPSAAVRRALENDGLPPGIAAASDLRVVESGGTYSGRKVTYIRVFDPARAAEQGLEVRGYRDLETHRNLVLRTGHVEKDGTVVITWRAPASDAPAPAREQADRALHADDQRYVFPAGHGAAPGGG